MSISLKELFEASGYDFEDYDDLQRVKNLLYEAEDLAEEVDEKIDYIENRNVDEEQAEADAEIAEDIAWRETNGLL